MNNRMLAGRFASFLLASFLFFPMVWAQNCTNCTVTMVSVNDNGVVMSVTLYLLAGFAAVFVLPRWVGTPDMSLKTTWDGIVGDVWRRAFYAGSIILYFVLGVFLYNSAVANAIDMQWLFVGLSWVLSIAMFVMLAYMIFKIAADGMALAKRFIEAERYGRNYKNG